MIDWKLEQAIEICLEHDVVFKEIENWSTQEGFKKKFNEFIGCLEKEKLSTLRSL